MKFITPSLIYCNYTSLIRPQTLDKANRISVAAELYCSELQWNYREMHTGKDQTEMTQKTTSPSILLSLLPEGERSD